MITVNGKKLEFSGAAGDLLLREGFDTDRIVVELNREILPKEQYSDRILQDGDSLEVLEFVGGG